MTLLSMKMQKKTFITNDACIHMSVYKDILTAR